LSNAKFEVGRTFEVIKGFKTLNVEWFSQAYGKLLLIGLWNYGAQHFETTIEVWFQIVAKAGKQLSKFYYSLILLSCFKGIFIYFCILSNWKM